MTRTKIEDESERMVQTSVTIPRWMLDWIEKNEDFNIHKFVRYNLDRYISIKEEILNA